MQNTYLTWRKYGGMAHLACVSWNSGYFFIVSSVFSSANTTVLSLNQIIKKRIFLCGSVCMARVWNRKKKRESHSTYRENKSGVRYQGDGRIAEKVMDLYWPIVYSFLQTKKVRFFFPQKGMVLIREIVYKNVHIQPANNCYMKYLCNSIKNSLHSQIHYWNSKFKFRCW